MIYSTFHSIHLFFCKKLFQVYISAKSGMRQHELKVSEMYRIN